MSPRDALRLRNVEVDGAQRDVEICDRAITRVEVATAHRIGPDEIDGAGGALIPGLHDHHIHLFALAAARQSITVDCRFATTLAQAVHDRPRGTWLRAVGYHESVLGEIDRRWLDAIAPDHPVRVQHRSGAMWVLNSAALRATGLEAADGRLLRIDDELRARIPPAVPDVGAIGRELASYGVTGVSDLTPVASAEDMATLASAVGTDDFPVEVMVTGAPSLQVGLVPGLVPDPGLGRDRHSGVTFGPAKVVVGDHELPSIDDLCAAFRLARRRGRAVAVHCVTRVGLILALAAWEEVGSVPGDRIEHAAVVPIEMIAVIRRLGLTVVTQPSFPCERGDSYLADVDPDDLDGLWRCRSLLDAGVAVSASTDAPYGSADPWQAIAAATMRTTSGGAAIGPGERVSAMQALSMFLTTATDPGGGARRIAVGAPGDVCLLDAPLHTVLESPSSAHVVATVGRAGMTWR